MYSSNPLGFYILALAIATVGSEPVCDLPTDPHIPKYKCSGFTRPVDFETRIQRPQLHADMTFLLENSNFSHIPANAFVGLNASVLELSNVKLETYALQRENPFVPLETSLRKVIISDDTTLPQWGLLAILQKLKTLRLSEMTNLRLTRDFNNLPASVKVINVAFSTISFVDDNWLSSLENLEVVAIRHCNLRVFKRSMLPRPARYLWRLDLYQNQLTTLPGDFTEDLPSLRFVTVENNQLTTFDEHCFAPLVRAGDDDVKVRFKGNPLHCDCSFGFVLTYPRSWLNASCETPEPLKNRFLTDISRADICAS